MKIAVAANGDTLESMVTEEYENSTYLLVVDMNDLSFRAYPNEERGSSSELGITRRLIEHDSEAVICGSIEQANFDALVAVQVTRYNGANYSVNDALHRMEINQLEIIRDYKGGEGMTHEHHHYTCSCGNHDE